MGQAIVEEIGYLLTELFSLLQEKDRQIFEYTIDIYNLSKVENPEAEVCKLKLKKMKIDFEMLDLTMESLTNQIALNLQKLKKEQIKIEPLFTFFSSFTLKKATSYVTIKPRNIDSEGKTKLLSKQSFEVYIQQMKKHLQVITKKVKYDKLRGKIIQLFSILSSQLHSKNSYFIGGIMENRIILQELLEFEYNQVLYEDSLFEDYFRFLVYQYEGIILEEVNVYPARKVAPQFKDSGFRATAYEVKHEGIKEIYFAFVGTESSQGTIKNKVSDVIYRNFLSEAFVDWQYNLEAIVLGTGKSQISDGIKFVRIMIKHLKPMACYGIGHSLGGNLVQTIQIIDHSFDSVYTVNSAPVQVRQLYHLKPHLLSSKKWNELLMREISIDDWPNSNNDIIAEVLKEEGKHITNESFYLDFTRGISYLHGTSLIGKKNYYVVPVTDYPMQYNLREYFTERDLFFLYEMIDGNIKLNFKNDNTWSVISILLNIVNDKSKILTSGNYKKATVDFLIKLLDYVEKMDLSCSTEIMKNKKTLIDNLTNNLVYPEHVKKKQLPAVILKLKNDFSFIFHLNKDMVDMIYYLHGIAGAKWVIRKGKLELPVF